MATGNRKFSLILGLAQRIRSYAGKVIALIVPPPPVAVSGQIDNTVASQSLVDSVAAAAASQMQALSASQGLLSDDPVAVQSVIRIGSA